MGRIDHQGHANECQPVIEMQAFPHGARATPINSSGNTFPAHAVTGHLRGDMRIGSSFSLRELSPQEGNGHCWPAGQIISIKPSSEGFIVMTTIQRRIHQFLLTALPEPLLKEVDIDVLANGARGSIRILIEVTDPRPGDAEHINMAIKSIGTVITAEVTKWAEDIKRLNQG